MNAYEIACIGNHPLPSRLSRATDADVETILVEVVVALGWPASEVEIERSASTMGCMATIDVVAWVRGTPLVVARPALY